MTSDQCTALVLRFRDLVTVPGDTIRHHADIAQGGFVWWGWWCKSGEEVPSDVLRQIKESHAKVYLFDSGHLQLRSAECEDIKWDADYLRIDSPDPERTPEYYRTQKYKLWFKIRSFGEPIADPLAVLHAYSYLRVDEFFENRQSRYTPFYNKRVYDLDELKQQDRTIWFLRDYADPDPIHMVSVLNSHHLVPCDFPRTYTGTKSANLLWISDLHCGPHHAFPVQSTGTYQPLGHELELAAAHHGIEDFGAVIISGDLTWQASPNEFRDAKEVIARIATSPTALDNYRFAICPGNHDLRFSDVPHHKGERVTHALPEARAEYEAFYKDLFYVAPNQFLSMGRRFLMHESAPVEIVCLNSALLQQSEGWFQGHGHLGQEQLDHAAKEYGWDKDEQQPRPFRLVVLHHHVLPVTLDESPIAGTSYSVVLDAERLLRWLCKYRVDLVLHGHMHARSFSKLHRPVDVANPGGAWHTLTVMGLGSTGVRGHKDTGSTNMFSVITFMQKVVKVRVFSVHPGDAESTRLFELDLPRTA